MNLTKTSENDSVPRYIGITDFRTPAEVRSMLALLDESPPGWKLMVGVMASPKSLLGLPTDYDGVWLKPADFPTVFLDDSRAFNVPHWADYKGRTAPSHLEELMALCQGKAHALQLDMPWPSPDLVFDLRKSFDVPVILQVGRRAMDELGIAQGKARSMLDRINGYGTHVSGILLDMSGGEGIELNPEYLVHYVEAIHKDRPDLTIAVAGGLGPDSLDLVEPLLERFPWLSRDAQSKLRKSGKSTDPIDWDRATGYIVGSIEQNKRFAPHLV